MPVTLRFQSTGVVPGDARPVLVRGGSLTIGRGPENDLVLPDPDRQISKRHCAIEERGGEAVVIDFSSNGTFLNYGKVPLGKVPSPLSDGDILTMGPFELLVSITPGASPAREGVIADPLPDPRADLSGSGGFGQGGFAPGGFGAGGFGAGGILPPFEDAPAPVAGGGGIDLPDGPGEVDFLDSLLGPATPRGPSGVERAQLGDDGLLPPLGPDDFAPPTAPAASAAATQYERQEPFHDHFQASSPASRIPDDWDDLLGGDEPLAPPAPLPDPGPDPFAEPGDPPLPEVPEVPEAPVVASPEADIEAADPVEQSDAPVAPLTPAPAPEAPAPVAPQPAGQPGAGSQPDLMAAFLEGLGTPDLRITPAEAPATMRRLGTALRSMITGLREVLMTRASIKQEFRIGQTVIASGGNNPLKFSVSADQAIEAMVRPGGPGWLSPDLAAEQALQDLKAHEVAMLTGMEAALKDLLSRLDPAKLEARLETKGGIGGLLKGKKARYWELYETLYAEISDQAENEFHELFAREFARAYREQLERLK